MNFYNKYSDFLKYRYGTKVYKLPINLPVSCPNKKESSGCTFCADIGTGFEAAKSHIPVSEQMQLARNIIQKKYKAEKFIAYFQNYTNTFMPLGQFKQYILEAASMEDIVEISVSTRPDCIREDYLTFLKQVSEKYSLSITIELGLQTVNYHTLDEINRGHGLAEFLDAVLRINRYGFTICAHVILNLPTDSLRDMIETAKVLSVLPVQIVKLHSLYIAKNSAMARDYQKGLIEICSKEEYFLRLKAFIEHLSPNMVIERLFSRIPEEDSLFSNWQTSWRKLANEFEVMMESSGSCQGKNFDYINGSGLRL